jgi:hypothetical protein
MACTHPKAKLGRYSPMGHPSAAEITFAIYGKPVTEAITVDTFPSLVARYPHVSRRAAY